MTGMDAFITYVAGLTGNVYPMRIPYGIALPAVTIFQVSGAPIGHLAGVSQTARLRVQVSCWGDNYTDAKLLASELASALNGFSGTMSGVRVQGVHLLSETDGQLAPIDSSDKARFFTALDFHYWYEGS